MAWPFLTGGVKTRWNPTGGKYPHASPYLGSELKHNLHVIQDGLVYTRNPYTTFTLNVCGIAMYGSLQISSVGTPALECEQAHTYATNKTFSEGPTG